MQLNLLIRRIVSKVCHLAVIFFSKFLPKRGRVYMFHSIGDDKHELNVSIDSFERTIKSLKNTNVVRLEDWEKERDFVGLTFDDVADSFYYNAFPILKRYNLPFTIFVSCSLLDTDNYISTTMLKKIAECELCTVGSHGFHHTFYADYSPEEIIDELSTSKNKLKELTNKKIELFAFPYGSLFACGLKNKKSVINYYKYGFGTISSPLTKYSLLPNYYLPRIMVGERGPIA